MPKIKNKIEAVWAILCSGSSVDIDSNNLSIFGIIEELGFVLKKEIPRIKLKNGIEVIRVPIPLNLVTLYRREGDLKEDVLCESRLILVDPSGKVVQRGITEFTMKGGKKRMRLRSPLNQLALTKSGEYTIRLWLKTKEQKSFKNLANISVEVAVEFKD